MFQLTDALAAARRSGSFKSGICHRIRVGLAGGNAVEPAKKLFKITPRDRPYNFMSMGELIGTHGRAIERAHLQPPRLPNSPDRVSKIPFFPNFSQPVGG